MNKESVVAGIDLGSSSIRVIIGHLNTHGAVEILGFSQESFKGVRGGVIADIDGVVEVLERNLLQAEDDAAYEIRQAFVNVGGHHVHSRDMRSAVPIRHHDKKIRNLDLYHAVYDNKVFHTQELQAFQVIQPLVKSFMIDGHEGVHYPLGMVANELGADLHVFFAQKNVLQNMLSVFDLLGVDIQACFPNAYISAEAILAYEEKDLGVVCLDIGAQTTDMIAYRKGQVVWSLSLPWGGDRITEKISQHFCVAWDKAKDIKEQFGHVASVDYDGPQEIVVQHVATHQLERISVRDLKQVIENELKEFLQDIVRILQQEQRAFVYPAGVVLTGGGAGLRGISILASQIFNCHVRTGSVSCPVRGRERSLRGYQHALCAGLVRVGHTYNHNQSIKPPSKVDRMKYSMNSFFADLF